MPGQQSTSKLRHRVRSQPLSRRTPAGERKALGKLYTAWRDMGKKRSEFQALLKTAGYKVTVRTLNNWRMASAKKMNIGISPQKIGRPRIMSRKMERVVTGYIIAQNEAGEIVTSQSVREFCRNRLGRNMSLPTVRAYMRKNHITLRTTRRVKVLSSNELAGMYRCWLREQQEKGWLDHERT